MVKSQVWCWPEVSSRSNGAIGSLTNITFVNRFICIPSTALGIRHRNLAFIIIIWMTHTSMSRACYPFFWVTLGIIERTTFVFFKESVNVIFWDSTVFTTAAREGCHTTSCIHNNSLPLWGASTPEIHIVCSVSLVQSTHLLGNSTASDRADFWPLKFFVV